MSFVQNRRTVIRVMSSALAIKEEMRRDVPVILASVREPCKIIAFDAGITERGFEKNKAGESLPSLPVAIAYAKRIPAFREYLLRWLDAATGDSGEDPSRVLADIERLLMERGKKPA